jgi:hypothetical protein
MAKKGGGGDSIPQVNPQQLVQQQAAENRISQFGPQGNLIFGKVDGAGQFQPGTDQAASVVEESPFQQRYREGGEDLALTAQNLAAPRIQNLPAAPIDTTKLPGFIDKIDWSKIDKIPGSADFSADADKLEKASFERAMGLMSPQFEKQERSLETSLANKGIPIGSEAHTGAYTDFRRARDEAMSKAALDAVAAGRGEQSRLFGQAMAGHQAGVGDQTTAAGLTNQTRAQQVQEQQALRSANLQEIGAMLGINPVAPVEAKSFFAPSPVDVTGPYQISQNAALANQQMANQSQNSLLSGLFGLGSAGIGAALKWSDKRLKKDIERVGETDSGVPLYKYRSKGTDGPLEIGVLADELRKTKPEAVITTPSGFKAVDYEQVQ